MLAAASGHLEQSTYCQLFPSVLDSAEMMDRKILLLMLALIRVSRPQDLMVSQPSSAEGTEGGSVTLTCSYKSTSESKVGSYWWVKDPGLVVKSTSQEFTGRVNCTSDQGFLLEKRADIEIQNLRLNDSGMYRCVVNIHGLQETSGKGTKLQVMKRVSWPQDLVVSQPSFAQGTEGGSVTLHCSYKSAREPKVGSYQWVKNQSLLVKNTTSEFMGRVNGTSDQHFLLERRADIEIWHLKLNDSGMYQCVVEIHGLQATSGSGTELQVLDRGGCQAKASRSQQPQQEHETELNYTEVTVTAQQNPMSQREVVTYIAVDTQDG
ncbi:UNVERIFIED_CONTAM: hypothetical protein K2H54_060859 [Gekko kuhli]